MSEQEQEHVIIRDNRKIDPVTGKARKAPAASDAQQTPPVAPSAPQPPEGTDAASAAGSPEAPADANAQLLEERTRDLQRLSAEYANYRKRAERERLAAGELAVGRALAEFLPVLDDLDRARAHGDLTGALKAVADKLEAAFAKLGVVAFGEVGDPFDPAIHEAVMHAESDEVTVPTATTIMRVGYKHGDRLLRPAMVGVTDPAHPAPAAAAGAQEADGAEARPEQPSQQDSTEASPPEGDAGGG